MRGQVESFLRQIFTICSSVCPLMEGGGRWTLGWNVNCVRVRVYATGTIKEAQA
jgi:hypothetical protein